MKTKKCRCKKCVAFRKENSFEFLDIYGLYHSLAKHICPRLKAFKENTYSFPSELGSKGWDKVLDKMIYAFETISDCEIYDPKKYKKIEEGLSLFSKYFRDLWM